MRLTRVAALTSLVIAAYAVAEGPATATHDSRPAEPHRGPSRPPAGQPATDKHPKLASSIVQLIDAADRVPRGVPMGADNLSAVEPAVGALITAGLLNLDEQGRLQVMVHTPRVDPGRLDELRGAGVVSERTAAGRLQARVHVKALRRLADLDSVTAVVPPVRTGRDRLQAQRGGRSPWSQHGEE